MRIVVNDIAASTGGALSILKDFYQYVRANDRENEWVFLLGDSYLEETDRIQVRILPEVKKNGLKKIIFDFFTGRSYIKALNPYVVFSLQNIITFGLKVRQVVYIHQSIPFQREKSFSFLRREERSLAVYQHIIGRIIKASAHQADQVIVQTQWMKDAVCRQAKVPAEKVTAILPQVGDLSAYRQEHVFSNHAFFYPTAPASYKNNACIEKACELLQQKGYSDFIVKLTLPAEAPHGVICYTGVLPRGQILMEYNRATLIFPSYIESFGLPLAEARQMGTLVLASDCPFSREVLAGYENAYFFDPFQPQALADLMEQVMRGDIQRKQLDMQRKATDGWENVYNAVRGDS